MRDKPLQSSTPRALALALVLTVCAASGLAAGMTTRVLAGGALTASTSTGTSGNQTHSPTSSVPAASPTGTTIAPVVPPAGFSVHAEVQPNSISAGQPFTVVATVVSAEGAPLAGALCNLGAAPGSAPLFTPWPDPVVTDATGTASWNLTAPSAAPGVYTLDVVVYGTHYKADWRPSVTLTA